MVDVPALPVVTDHMKSAVPIDWEFYGKSYFGQNIPPHIAMLGALSVAGTRVAEMIVTPGPKKASFRSEHEAQIPG